MKEIIPRIWWPKADAEILKRAEECRVAGLDLAWQACLDEISRRNER